MDCLRLTRILSSFEIKLSGYRVIMGDDRSPDAISPTALLARNGSPPNVLRVYLNVCVPTKIKINAAMPL